jgi:dATP pyrophosphohydrolase
MGSTGSLMCPECVKDAGADHRYKRPESVLVVIWTGGPDDLEVLLLERSAHPGYWQSVTGSLEAGEAPVQTACREVQEETGIETCPEMLIDWQQINRYAIYPLWRDRYAPGVTHNVEHVFSLRLVQPMPVLLCPQEHRASRWLPHALAASACFSPSNRLAILSLHERFFSPQTNRQALAAAIYPTTPQDDNP